MPWVKKTQYVTCVKYAIRGADQKYAIRAAIKSVIRAAGQKYAIRAACENTQYVTRV